MVRGVLVLPSNISDAKASAVNGGNMPSNQKYIAGDKSAVTAFCIRGMSLAASDTSEDKTETAARAYRRLTLNCQGFAVSIPLEFGSSAFTRRVARAHTKRDAIRSRIISGPARSIQK